MLMKTLSTTGLILALTMVAQAATFSEDWNGTIGDPWPSVWSFEGTNSTSIQSVDSRLIGRTSGADATTTVAYVNTISGASYTDITITGYSSNTNPEWGIVAYFNAGANAGDLSDSSYYYVVIDDGGTPKMEIHKVVNGVMTQPASITSPLRGTAPWRSQRFTITDDGAGGLNLTFKYWTESAGESTATVLTYHDTSPLAAGGIGVISKHDSGRSIYFDQFDATYTLIPEPASLALLGLGALLVLPRRRRAAV